MWWRDHRWEFPALSDLARTAFCVTVTNAGSERLEASSSVKDIRFYISAFKAKNEAPKVE